MPSYDPEREFDDWDRSRMEYEGGLPDGKYDYHATRTTHAAASTVGMAGYPSGVYGGTAKLPSAKKSILDEASEIVSGARRKAYGRPENNFARIAALWNAYLNGKPNGPLPITNEDTALMMILVKVARLIESPNHRDSMVDLAGYAATLEMLMENPNV